MAGLLLCLLCLRPRLSGRTIAHFASPSPGMRGYELYWEPRLSETPVASIRLLGRQCAERRCDGEGIDGQKKGRSTSSFNDLCAPLGIPSRSTMWTKAMAGPSLRCMMVSDPQLSWFGFGDLEFRPWPCLVPPMIHRPQPSADGPMVLVSNDSCTAARGAGRPQFPVFLPDQWRLV